MKSDVSREAATTLSTIDTALRRADDLHWSDPAFLAWEADQVGELQSAPEDAVDSGGILKRWWCLPGRSSAHSAGVHSRRKMVDLVEDGGGPGWRVYAHDYPPPEATTYGPLLLGPEPVTVLPLRCVVCSGEGETDWDCCAVCDGTGTAPPLIQDGQEVIW